MHNSQSFDALGMITIILLLVMITTVFFGFKQRGEVLLIPVATLFAFTQLRQTMPGAPEGFGKLTYSFLQSLAYMLWGLGDILGMYNNYTSDVSLSVFQILWPCYLVWPCFHCR